MYKRFITILIAMLLLLLTMLQTACSSQEQNESQSDGTSASTALQEESTATETTLETEKGTEADPINEDGFIIPEEGVRPVAVMIDNEGSKVLPQGGLDKAQIIYEMIVEGGLTRFMPVFWGTDPELIGPVRSSRHYFLDFCMEHDAIYTHVGWSTMAEADIPKLGINNINGLYVSSDIIWELTNDPYNWQDSYTSMEKLMEYSEKKKYKTTTKAGFPFKYNLSDVVPAGGEDAAIVTFNYPSMTSKYEYDANAGVYKRFRYGKPHMERVSGKQLEAKNIIVRYTKNYTIKGDKYGRQEMITTGSGDGYYITCGKAIKIKWSKKSRSAQTRYMDESGNDITLNKGQTWIQVMPLNSKVTFE